MAAPTPPPDPAPASGPAAPAGGATPPAAQAAPGAPAAPAVPAASPSPVVAPAPTAAVVTSKGAGLAQVMPALSLVLGSLVLLPATTGQLLRPYKWELLLPSFVVLATVAAVLLVAAVLIGGIAGTPKPAQVARGFGSGVGLLALAVLVTFVTANFCDSLYATPRVLNIKFAPVPLVAGKVAEADVEVLNKSGKPVHYVWRFNGQVVPGLHTAYIRLPDAPGRYPVEVELRLAPESLVVDASASAPPSATATTFKTLVDVLADSVTPTPPSIVVTCCKGAPCEKRKQETATGKVHPAPNQKSCP